MAPAGESSILIRPPAFFSIVSISNLAASWTIEVGGQALCTFHLIGAWAVTGAGALYEPARKARRAVTRARPRAEFKETILRIRVPPLGWRFRPVCVAA